MVINDILFSLALDCAHQPADQLPLPSTATLEEVRQSATDPVTPEVAWARLAALLLAPHPSHGFRALRAAGALTHWLPELEALFGVPQLSDEPTPVDVGQHQLRVVDAAAEAEAPLAVRFAALAHKLGKGGTPREIWPHHYKHEQRGQAALDAWAQRFAIPPDALDLARLAVDEADRIHRAADVRAGAIAALLDRLDAAHRPERFEQLLAVCTCDFAAYPGHTAGDYAKAPRLRRALAAFRHTPVAGLDADAALQARAEAVALALRSADAVAR